MLARGPKSRPKAPTLSAGMSFREKLMGGMSDNLMAEHDDWVFEDDEDDDYNEDMEAECPLIYLTKDAKERIRRPWKRTLIIKLLGKSIGYSLLLKKINNL